jgi:NAD(P)-dependent dehydrogenase (short-subunit alcohol dehydrogenase family)
LRTLLPRLRSPRGRQPAWHGLQLQAHSSQLCASSSGAIVNIIHGGVDDPSVGRLQDHEGSRNRLDAANAIQNAPYGIRANVILPGLMDTPMASTRCARTRGRARAKPSLAERCPGAAASEDGDSLGCRQCSVILASG